MADDGVIARVQEGCDQSGRQIASRIGDGNTPGKRGMSRPSPTRRDMTERLNPIALS
jgi:hypothetical protein